MLALVVEFIHQQLNLGEEVGDRLFQQLIAIFEGIADYQISILTDTIVEILSHIS